MRAPLVLGERDEKMYSREGSGIYGAAVNVQRVFDKLQQQTDSCDIETTLARHVGPTAPERRVTRKVQDRRRQRGLNRIKVLLDSYTALWIAERDSGGNATQRAYPVFRVEGKDVSARPPHGPGMSPCWFGFRTCVAPVAGDPLFGSNSGMETRRSNASIFIFPGDGSLEWNQMARLHICSSPFPASAVCNSETM